MAKVYVQIGRTTQIDLSLVKRDMLRWLLPEIECLDGTSVYLDSCRVIVYPEHIQEPLRYLMKQFSPEELFFCIDLKEL